jgi:hypothetical protein
VVTGDEAPDGTDRLRLLAAIGSPVALATALMFYFGWVRTRTEAQAFGYDVSVTGMSVQDYLLKSIYVLYLPLLVPLLAAILLAWLHHRLIEAADRRTRFRDSLTWLAGALTVSWTVWGAIGIVLLLFAPPARLYVIPATLTMMFLCIIYGNRLWRRLHGHDRLSSTIRALVLAALILTVFWDTESIATAVGNAYVAQIASNPKQLVAVTLYSPRNLDISVAGVTTTRLTGPDSAYAYRYDGLRLLQLSGGRYLLISQNWDRTHRQVIVIPDSSNYRVQFHR